MKTKRETGWKVPKAIVVLMFACLLLWKGNVIVKAENYIPLQVNKEVVAYDVYNNTYMYEFTVPGNGYIQIVGKDSGRESKVNLYDESGQSIYSSYSDSGDTFVSRRIGFRAGTKLYLKISNHWGSGNVTFKVTYQPSSNWEQEFNDNTASATKIVAGKKMYGNGYCDYDVDYYRFTIKKNSKVTIEMGPDYIDGNNHYWSAKLVDARGREYKFYDCSRPTIEKNSFYLKKGTYYIRVYNWDGEDFPYYVKYSAKSFSVNKPSIQKVKLGVGQYWFTYRPYLRAMKVTNKGEYTGYDIRVSTSAKGNGNVQQQSYEGKKGTTFKGTSYFEKSVKTYYVKARTYVTTPFGDKLYSKYCKPRKVSLTNSQYKKVKK